MSGGPGSVLGPGIDPNAPIVDQLPPVLVHEPSAAEEAINSKWNMLGGFPGEPLFPGPEGLIAAPGGFFRQYARGRICRNRAVGDEAFYVHRAEHRYDQLGGPNSFLGWPTSDDLPDPVEPDSGVTKFQNGAIYWWPDIGAIEMQHILLRYVGLHCFGETNDGFAGLSASDEPYVIFGVVPMITDLQNTVLTRIYNGVDAGESRHDDLELYRGLPFGVAFSITLAEHDHDDPNKFKEEVKGVVKKASDGVVQALVQVPVIGTVLGPIAGVVLVLAGPTISSEVNALLGTEDDHVSTVQLTITPKDMMRLTRTERQNFFGIMARLESPLLSGDGGSYKVYFDIEAVQPG